MRKVILSDGDQVVRCLMFSKGEIGELVDPPDPEPNKE